jgi:SAM-dependent methyltransferase
MTAEIDGYTLEIDYTYGYSSILSPAHLRLLAIQQGVPFPTRRPLRYLELGCGNGVSLNIHAAASPGEYWGVDVNPSHIAFAKKLGEVSGANVKFLEMSFADLLNYECLPEFEVIVAHGVWTWISDESRRCIVEILKHKLVDGGIFFLSYNSLPGSAGIVPLQKLVQLHFKKNRKTEGIEKRLAAAIQFAEELRDAGSEFFISTPIAVEWLNLTRSCDLNYLCHEYLNANWRPFLFSEVADTLSEIELHFVANADFEEYHDDLMFNRKGLELLRSIVDPIARQTASDILRNRVCRRDVFVRGSQSLSAAERAAELCANEFVLLTPLNEVPESAKFGPISYSLSAAPYGEILKCLAEDDFRSKTIVELTESPSLAHINAAELSRSLLFLMTIDLVYPVQPRDLASVAIEPCRRMNLEAFRCVTNANWTSAVSSPVLGNGVILPKHWRHFLESKFSGALDPQTWASYAWQQSHHDSATSYNRIMEGTKMLREAVKFQRQLPILERLGINFNAFNED